MIRSLTGFGRAEVEHGDLRYSVELRSVNNRFLDISTRLPRNLMNMDGEIRARLRGRVQRGKLNVLIEEPREDVQRARLEVDPGAAKSLVESLRRVAEETGLAYDLTLSDLAPVLSMLTGSESERIARKRRELVLRGLDEAIDRFDETAAAEGENLAEDFRARLDEIAEIAANIESRAAENRDQSLAKLRERIEKYVPPDQVDERRLEQEVAYLIDRIDVTEEIVRLRSHLDLFRHALDNGGLVGKRLNFILQEMNREVNTIGSKASDADVAAWVVEAKEEVEKVREQVQNVA